MADDCDTIRWLRNVDGVSLRWPPNDRTRLRKIKVIISQNDIPTWRVARPAIESLPPLSEYRKCSPTTCIIFARAFSHFSPLETISTSLWVSLYHHLPVLSVFSHVSCQFVFSHYFSVVVRPSQSRSPSSSLPQVRPCPSFFLISCRLLLTCPYQCNRFCLRNVDIWHTLASSCIVLLLTWSFLVFPLIHRSILISATCNLFSSFFLTAQHSAPYVIVGLITVLYTLSFSLMGTFLSHSTPVSCFNFIQASVTRLLMSLSAPPFESLCQGIYIILYMGRVNAQYVGSKTNRRHINWTRCSNIRKYMVQYISHVTQIGHINNNSFSCVCYNTRYKETYAT